MSQEKKVTVLNKCSPFFQSIKAMNRIGDKGQLWWSPTLTENESDLQPAMWTKLSLHLYRDWTARSNRPSTPYSWSTPHRKLRGTRSNALSKSTKHMWTGWANFHAPSRILVRVRSWSSGLVGSWMFRPHVAPAVWQHQTCTALNSWPHWWDVFTLATLVQQKGHGSYWCLDFHLYFFSSTDDIIKK